MATEQRLERLTRPPVPHRLGGSKRRGVQPAAPWQRAWDAGGRHEIELVRVEVEHRASAGEREPIERGDDLGRRERAEVPASGDGQSYAKDLDGGEGQLDEPSARDEVGLPWPPGNSVTPMNDWEDRAVVAKTRFSDQLERPQVGPSNREVRGAKADGALSGSGLDGRERAPELAGDRLRVESVVVEVLMAVAGDLVTGVSDSSREVRKCGRRRAEEEDRREDRTARQELEQGVRGACEAVAPHGASHARGLGMHQLHPVLVVDGQDERHRVPWLRGERFWIGRPYPSFHVFGGGAGVDVARGV